MACLLSTNSYTYTHTYTYTYTYTILTNSYKKILSGEYKIAKWVSPDVTNLISKILEVDPSKRYNVNDVSNLT